MIHWTDAGCPPVDSAVIEALEAELGLRFPEALKKVWARGDGREVENPKFYRDAPDGRELVDVMHHLLTVGDGELRRVTEVVRDFGVDRDVDLNRVIPIGNTGDGFICLDYRVTEQDPPVVDLSMSYAETVEPGEEVLIYVANSFADFERMFTGDGAQRSATTKP